MITLRAIDEDNYKQCFDLKAPAEKEAFVDSVTYSLAEAWVYGPDIKPFAIYDDETMVGFVSMYVGEENPQIINFLIDCAFQKKGLGTQAAKTCIDCLRNSYGARRVSVPVALEHTAAQSFWSKLGFTFSDSIEDGYVFMRLSLP
ncbi:MAG: GNAT family N-acetyltransferase [Oscillospiraceae bacterium]|nr:GNAT family N-acetyltransferase [Oscillospiraceae bacterium]